MSAKPKPTCHHRNLYVEVDRYGVRTICRECGQTLSGNSMTNPDGHRAQATGRSSTKPYPQLRLIEGDG